jgi:molybdopterin synthase sulfur carrier subunit
MATVWIPTQMQNLTGGCEEVSVEGSTVREIIMNLDRAHSGFHDQLCQGSGLKPTIAVAVDGEISSIGIRQKVTLESEIFFLPAISGG